MQIYVASLITTTKNYEIIAQRMQTLGCWRDDYKIYRINAAPGDLSRLLTMV